MANWLDSTDFPSGGGGSSAEPNSIWVHPKTNVVYFYDHDKLSWMTLGSSGARMYSDTIDPGLGGIELMDGDMWWDSRALELRVYHKPIKLNSGDPSVEGRWISSTNPEMTLEDLSRNMIIGLIKIDGNSQPLENAESQFKIDIVGGADSSKLEYLWKCVPPSITRTIDGVESVYSVIISNSDRDSTSIIFPAGMALIEENLQVSYNVSCMVSAKSEFADQFVKPQQISPTIRVYPIPINAPAVQYVNLTIGVDKKLEIASGSLDVVEGGIPAGDAKPIMFVITPDTIGSNLKFSTKTQETSNNGNDILSQYFPAYGPVQNEAVDVQGYSLTLSLIDSTKDTIIYMWNDLDNTISGSFTLKAQ